MNAKNASPKISIEKLVKEFDGKTVLKDISLSVDAGQSLCIIGTSGCGKSVTLKCLLGLITPSGGSIKVDGLEMVGQTRSQREGYLKEIWYDFPVWRAL